MKVFELIAQLLKYNSEAEVNVIAHCMPHKFSLIYGGNDGCDKDNCDSVNFYVDELCIDELCTDERTEEEKIRAWDDGGCSVGSSLNIANAHFNNTVC
jgi:hypothetical protein